MRESLINRFIWKTISSMLQSRNLLLFLNFITEFNTWATLFQSKENRNFLHYCIFYIAWCWKILHSSKTRGTLLEAFAAAHWKTYWNFCLGVSNLLNKFHFRGREKHKNMKEKKCTLQNQNCYLCQIFNKDEIKDVTSKHHSSYSNSKTRSRREFILVMKA